MPKTTLFDKQEILEKAMFLFWRKGYYNTSIQDLVDHLQINRSSLYNTFGGKKALFHKAFQFHRSMGTAGLKQFLATQTSAIDAIRAMFWKILHDDLSDQDCKGCFIANTTTEMLPDDPYLTEVITTHKEQMEQAFQKLLQKGIESGEINPTIKPSIMAGLLYTLMSGFRVTGKTKPTMETSLAQLETVLKLLIHV